MNAYSECQRLFQPCGKRCQRGRGREVDWGGIDWNEELQEDSFTIFLSPSKLLEALSQATSCHHQNVMTKSLGGSAQRQVKL